MAAQTKDVATGAAQGALTGSAIMPGVGTAVGGVLGAIGGYIGSSSASREAERQRSRNRRAAKKLRPQTVLRVARDFQPKFRSMIAAGIGPGITGSVARRLGRTGLAGTGAGEAIRGLAASAPGIIASQGALDFALNLQRARAATTLGSPSPSPSPSRFLGSLAGGLQGGLGTYLAIKEAQDRGEPTAESSSLQTTRGVQAVAAGPGTVAPNIAPPGIPNIMPNPVEASRPRNVLPYLQRPIY